ncbi:MAG: hypothetical protein MUC87_03590 [Bacteroidia bacterium]|jgi:hypothetical protein|nr:hypothetical protein [Bacteroidia bacterium]
MKEESEIPKKTDNQEKPFFTPGRVFLGLLVLGALGYGAWYITRRSSKPAADLFTPGEEETPGKFKINVDTPPAAPAPGKTTTVNIPPVSSGTTTNNTKPASDFPLKKGSRGAKVKQLQNLLNTRKEITGITLTPDGEFGSKTQQALEKLGWPTVITEEHFQHLTVVPASDIADLLYKGARAQKIETVLSALSLIKTPEKYNEVNAIFKPKGLINGKNTTIVTGLLEVFKNPSDKDKLNLAFISAGLKKKDGKWYVPGNEVSGIERRALITTRPTIVWRTAKHSVQVGNQTIIGYEIFSNNGITHFETIDGIQLFVQTEHIKYA